MCLDEAAVEEQTEMRVRWKGASHGVARGKDLKCLRKGLMSHCLESWFVCVKGIRSTIGFGMLTIKGQVGPQSRQPAQVG